MRKVWNWILDNPNRSMFLIPILLVAAISISHVVTWYEMANPISWAIYLSIAIEVGAMTALVAATNKIRGGVWFMFGLVTFIQMIGNIFYSYYQIDETSELFNSWVELTSPIWEMAGTTSTIGLKRWLAFLEGGLLPLISLTSLHFFVTYEKEEESEEEVKKKISLEQGVVKNTMDNPNEGITPEMKKTIIEKEIKKEVVKVEEPPIKVVGRAEPMEKEDDTDEVEELVEEDFLEALESDSYEQIKTEEMKENKIEIEPEEEFDESHALDLVMNQMVDDLLEDESVETIEELMDILEDETIVEEITDVEESKDEETLKGRDDVTINNKPPNRKMGIDRIK
tara:strand:+ start:4707 stop:5726 length:1020 start_codon:yes stop_codon:yes gene_type:complete